MEFIAKCINCGVSYNPVDCQGLMKEVIICIDARDTKAWSAFRSGGENAGKHAKEKRYHLTMLKLIPARKLELPLETEAETDSQNQVKFK